MRKVSAKHLQWLGKELSLLENEGVVSSETTGKIKTYYDKNTQSGLHWAIVAFSIFGALLIGSGIILLFAHNWEFLTRPARAVISFLPLLIGIALSALALFKNKSVAMTESAGIFHTLAVGASIALIGQTYHLPSNTPAFLLSWALLILPLVFMLRSTLAFLIYCTLALSWAGIAQDHYGFATGFWGLILPAIFYVIQRVKQTRNAPSTLLSVWALLYVMTIGIGITLERTVPGLWIVAYAAFLTTAALFGRSVYGDQQGWSNPLKTFGTIGIVVLTYLFTWADMWADIGWHHHRSGWNYKQWGVWFDSGFTVLLIIGWAIASLHAIRKRSFETITLAVFPLITGICYMIQSSTDADLLNTLIFNGFMLLFGIMFIVQGCREITLRKLNGGMAILAVLIVSRFFDADFDFLARGIAFITLGGCFLTANLIMIRRKKQNEAA
jgi:uncharacterized membrane protein